MNTKKLSITLILLITFGQSGFPAWRFMPERPNDVQKGDIILSSSPSSAVGQMLNVLGHYWDHCMMITSDDGSLMTHNNFNMDKLEKILEKKDENIWITIFPYNTSVPKRLNPAKLSNAAEGILTEPTRNKGSFMARLTIQNEDDRMHVSEIADYMRDFSGYYILNAFATIKQYEPVYLGERGYGNGSHCSGAIWWASKYAGKPMSLFTLDNRNGVLSVCAKSMFGYVKTYVQRMIKEDLKGKYTSTVRKDIYNQLTTGKINADDKIAHQVVNTFLFNRSDRTDDYWKSRINDLVIESIAPDHLLMMGMPDIDGNFDMGGGMPGRQQTHTSYYNAITDYTTSGGYYYYYEDDDDSNAPPVDPRYTATFSTPCEMGLGVQCCR
jgi:hypothetical protein